jgi:hypothetical protein
MTFQKGNTHGRRWQAGQSGNPGGLPAYVRSVRLLAGQKSPRAMQRLAELLEVEDPRVVISAATAILDRAGVTPKEVSAHLGSRNPLDDLASDNAPEIETAELERLAREATKGRVPPSSNGTDIPAGDRQAIGREDACNMQPPTDSTASQ